MENPFKKLFGGGGEEAIESDKVEDSFEQKKVVDSDFEIRDDGIYVRKVYDDGSAGEWELLQDAPSDNAEVAREVYKEWRKAQGLTEIEDNQE